LDEGKEGGLKGSLVGQCEGFFIKFHIELFFFFFFPTENIVVGCTVTAIDNFEAEAEQELGVNENERLRVLSIENGWCTVESLDRDIHAGLVPLSYLKYAIVQG